MTNAVAPTPKPHLDTLGVKLAVLLGLLFMSTIPNFYIGSVVRDRQEYQRDAIQSVVKGWAARHKIGDIALRMTYSTIEPDYSRSTDSTKWVSETASITPTVLNVTYKDKTEVRHRGIFDIPIYKADVKFTGEIVMPKDPVPDKKTKVIDPASHRLVLVSMHTEAISEFKFKLNGEEKKLKRMADGLTFEFKDAPVKAGDILKFEIETKMQGYEGLDIATRADEFDMKMESAWPHPSFQGQLPLDQTVRKDGFTAHWRMIQSDLNQVATVNFIEPVNVYTQVTRTMKYALLTTLLVLSVLFLIETLAGLKLHPMQYLLMILPLTVYYILLTALSEHIGFHFAYILSSGAVIGLLHTYFKGIGAGTRQAASLAGVLGGMYGLILAMLSSEDYALLMGAIFLFAALAGFMLLTRKLNWAKGISVSQVVGNG